MIVSLTHTLAQQVFPVVKESIETALSFTDGELTSEDIYHALGIGKMILWIAITEERKLLGVVTAEIIHYPRKQGLRIVTLSGPAPLKLWGDAMHQDLVGYCKSNNLTFIEAIGREGLARLMKAFSAEKRYSIYRKEVV